jgi:hypothetical protein
VQGCAGGRRTRCRGGVLVLTPGLLLVVLCGVWLLLESLQRADGGG